MRLVCWLRGHQPYYKPVQLPEWMLTREEAVANGFVSVSSRPWGVGSALRLYCARCKRPCVE